MLAWWPFILVLPSKINPYVLMIFLARQHPPLPNYSLFAYCGMEFERHIALYTASTDQEKGVSALHRNNI